MRPQYQMLIKQLKWHLSGVKDMPAKVCIILFIIVLHFTFIYFCFCTHARLTSITHTTSGSALMLLKRYEEAHKALSSGYVINTVFTLQWLIMYYSLVYDPKNTQILKGISECEIELAKIASQKRRVAQLSDDFGMLDK